MESSGVQSSGVSRGVSGASLTLRAAASALRARVVFGGPVCCVRRALPPDVEDAAAFLAEQCFPAFDGVLGPDADILRHAAPYLTSPRQQSLRREVDAAVAAFRSVTRASAPRVVFGIVDTDSCRKLHVDYIALRMVSTFHGPGTEWAEEAAVDRVALAELAEDPDEANRRIVRDPSLIRRCQPGDWLFMKGEAWPGQSGHGAVHRSPPVEHERKRRLVLVLTLPRSRARASEPHD